MAKPALDKMTDEKLQALRERLTVERGKAEQRFVDELEAVKTEIDRRVGER